MKGLQLTANNADQCSLIFKHEDFSYAASLDINFQMFMPIHIAAFKIPSHQPRVNWKSLVPSYKYDTYSPNRFISVTQKNSLKY